MFVLSRKNRAPIAPTPPPGIWPGPFSEEGVEVSDTAVPVGASHS